AGGAGRLLASPPPPARRVRRLRDPHRGRRRPPPLPFRRLRGLRHLGTDVPDPAPAPARDRGLVITRVELQSSSSTRRMIFPTRPYSTASVAPSQKLRRVSSAIFSTV